jgi:hypothetical protein
VNDLHISERLIGSQTNQTPPRPREMPYPDLLGVKWLTGPQGQNSAHELPIVFRYRRRVAGRGMPAALIYRPMHHASRRRVRR